jgi:hypothetical protein
MRDSIHTTDREVIYTHAYVHADIPNANTRACFARIPTYILVHNSIYHAQTCSTTTHSCEQAMCCTHLRVWSVELWASAAAMCCAPSAPMKLHQRLYAHVCVCDKTDIAHVRSSRYVISYIQPRARSYTPMDTSMPTYQIQTRVHALYVSLPSFQCTTQ